MRSRRPLRCLLTAAGALALMGHSPYRQWSVYRQTHLVLVADESAAGAAATGEAVARVVAAAVPRTRAVVAEAHSAIEVAKLLRSRQLPLGVLLAGDAADALLGRGPFAGEPPLPLRALAAVGPYRLVSLEDFPADLAAAIARALAGHQPEGAPPVAADTTPVPLHPALAGPEAPASGPRS